MSKNLSLALPLGYSGGGAFSPAQLPGLVFWAHADTLSSSPVSSWSYGPASLSQATGTSQPTWSSSSANVGNKPSVLYNGSQFMSAASTSALQVTDCTIIAVVYIVSYPAGFATLISKGSTGEFDTYVTSAGTPTFARNSSAQAFNAGTVATATKTIVSFTVAGAAAACYVNGTAQGTATAGGSTSTTNAVQVGQRGDAGTTLNGEEPEVIVCNQALPAGWLTQAHRYLGGKYGITVP